VRPGPAAFLTGYGRWFYVPGPVFAAGLVLALTGLVVATRRRRRGQERTPARDACLLFTAAAVFVLIPPAAFATFDWRYQLPQLTLIPVAAILGAAAIGGRLTRTATAGTARRTRPAPAESGLPAPGARSA
jgi:hypothetical protein